MNKAVVIDVDGTLLSTRGRMGAKTKSALRYLHGKGYLVILNSGRPRRNLEPLLAQLGFASPLICYNGAECIDQDGTALFRHDLPTRGLRQIYAEAKSFLTSFACEDETTIYAMMKDSYLSHYFPFAGMKLSFGAATQLPESGIMACLLRCPHRHDGRLEEICTRAGFDYRHWTSSTYSEVCRKGVDKASALRFLIDKYHLEKDGIYGFGDSSNDLGFLSLCGHPYCMASSKNEAMRNAFPLTKKGNSEDGVAFELIEVLGL